MKKINETVQDKIALERVQENYRVRHTQIHQDLKAGLLTKDQFNKKHDALTHALDRWYLEKRYKLGHISFSADRKTAYVAPGDGINDQIDLIKGRQLICGVEDLEA